MIFCHFGKSKERSSSRWEQYKRLCIRRSRGARAILVMVEKQHNYKIFALVNAQFESQVSKRRMMNFSDEKPRTIDNDDKAVVKMLFLMFIARILSISKDMGIPRLILYFTGKFLIATCDPRVEDMPTSEELRKLEGDLLDEMVKLQNQEVEKVKGVSQ